MNNPVWQPGPPKEAGWFWVEWKEHDCRLVAVWFFYFAGKRLFSKGVDFFGEITRHAGPLRVEIPDPMEPNCICGDRFQKFGHKEDCPASPYNKNRGYVGPVAIPEPVEPDSKPQPEPAGPCDVDGGFYVGVK